MIKCQIIQSGTCLSEQIPPPTHLLEVAKHFFPRSAVCVLGAILRPHGFVSTLKPSEKRGDTPHTTTTTEGASGRFIANLPNMGEGEIFQKVAAGDLPSALSHVSTTIFIANRCP